jgi:hypothetical protein
MSIWNRIGNNPALPVVLMDTADGNCYGWFADGNYQLNGVDVDACEVPVEVRDMIHAEVS